MAPILMLKLVQPKGLLEALSNALLVPLIRQLAPLQPVPTLAPDISLILELNIIILHA
jgi:hypothetical protein